MFFFRNTTCSVQATIKYVIWKKGLHLQSASRNLIQTNLVRKNVKVAAYRLGYSDYDVFKGNNRGFVGIGVKRNSEALLYNTYFKILSHFLQIGR